MALLAGTAVTAQNIYQLESFSNIDLNGTARYVGMGGAMNALGADMSVMSSNPAGIGLYRKSDASITSELQHRKMPKNSSPNPRVMFHSTKQVLSMHYPWEMKEPPNSSISD